MENETVKPMTERKKKLLLFRRQKELLDVFLDHGAISDAQYRKSLGDLISKMGITEEELTEK